MVKYILKPLALYCPPPRRITTRSQILQMLRIPMVKKNVSLCFMDSFLIKWNQRTRQTSTTQGIVIYRKCLGNTHLDHHPSTLLEFLGEIMIVSTHPNASSGFSECFHNYNITLYQKLQHNRSSQCLLFHSLKQDPDRLQLYKLCQKVNTTSISSLRSEGKIFYCLKRKEKLFLLTDFYQFLGIT